jgi:hypothetical protein
MPGESNHQTGLILYAQRQYEAASVQFRLAIGEEETSDRWNDWASAELTCGREVRAEWGYRRALHLNPAHRQAAVNLAVLLIAQGRLQESVPLLTPHAPSLSESEKAVLANLVMRRGGPGAPTPPPPAPNPQLLLDAFLTVISLIPNDDPTMPGDLRAANHHRKFDSRHYVEQCCELLKALPPEVQPLALAKFQENSKYDYRLLLVLACHYLALKDSPTALGFARQAIEVKPYDNHVQRVLIQAELAATPEEDRARHPWAGLDEYLAGCFCDRPWRQLELSTDGALHMCCPGWMSPPIGYVTNAPPLEVWNSPAAQEIRKSILDGSFKYCGRIHCAWISCRALPALSAASGALSPTTSVRQVDCYVHMESDPISPGSTAELPLVFKKGPSELVLSHDRTCNLACPKCRHDFYSAGRQEQQGLARMADSFLGGILKEAKILRLDGSGDPFASRHCRQLLQQCLTRDKYPKLRFSFMTNGLLFDRRTFEELDLRGRIRDINVSADAACEETYRVVLRGGDFKRLLTNLEFIDGLRVQEGEDFGLGLVFVVSALNFREMPEFVRLGKQFHAGIVSFALMRNQSGLPAEEFHKLNIANPDHPEHGEFLEILADKELSDPCVGWGTLGYLRPR